MWWNKRHNKTLGLTLLETCETLNAALVRLEEKETEFAHLDSSWSQAEVEDARTDIDLLKSAIAKMTEIWNKG